MFAAGDIVTGAATVILAMAAGRKAARSIDDYLRQNIWLGVINDPLAMQRLDEIGADRILWGSDFPHPPCTYPRTHEILDGMLAGLAPDVQRRIVGENVTPLYGFRL